MDRKVFINGKNSISPQYTFDNKFVSENFDATPKVFLQIVKPDYKKFIPVVKLRRMAKFMRMGLVAAKMAVNDSAAERFDAIIVGSGHGNVGDTQKFLTAILENNERMLVPTSFVQSTHNIVAGTIALALENRSYNMTYTHHSSAFEMSLLDALMLFEEQHIASALVGGVDEITPENVKRRSNTDIWNKKEMNSLQIFSNDNYMAAILGESSSFFVLSSDKTIHSYAELVDVNIVYNDITNINDILDGFVSKNNIRNEDIDMVIAGLNGVKDYDNTSLQIIEKSFPLADIAAYKQFVGEHPTASAYGLWMAMSILKTNKIPDEAYYKKKNDNAIKTILIFHQAFLSAKDFAMILVRGI